MQYIIIIINLSMLKWTSICFRFFLYVYKKNQKKLLNIGQQSKIKPKINEVNLLLFGYPITTSFTEYFEEVRMVWFLCFF